MKKHHLAAAILLASCAGTAAAADLPSRKEAPVFVPPPPPVLSWTGPYAGVNLGVGIGDGLFADPIALGSADFVGGATIGYNWQWPSSKWVVGVEADADYRGPVHASQQEFFNASASSNGYIGTARVRAGYVWADHLLVYATGGLAYGNVIAPTSYVGILSPGFSGVRINHNDTLLPGWTVGGGLEYLLTPNWSVKAEYLYAKLQHDNPLYWTSASFAPIGVCTRSAVSMVRVGVNYHFNWGAPAPVVAKY